MARLIAFVCGAAALLAATAADAAPVELRAAISDADGRVTLGELFDGAGAAGNVLVVTTPVGSGTVLDAGQLQRLAAVHGLQWANPTGIRRVIVRPGAEAPAKATRGSVQALTYTRSLAAGEIVSAEDLAWTKVVGAPVGAPRDADQLIGMVAKRPLREGAAAAVRDVAAPVVIHRDEQISVSFETGGVSLTMTAKAMQDASAGDSLNIQNLSSKKVIQAVAVGPGRAVVGPAAADARAAVQDTRQFASR